MTRAAWAKLAFYVFALVWTAGVYWNFGVGWALMLGGLIGMASALLLHDVDPEKGR